MYGAPWRGCGARGRRTLWRISGRRWAPASRRRRRGPAPACPRSIRYRRNPTDARSAHDPRPPLRPRRPPRLDRMRGLTSTIVYDDRMNVVRAEFRGVAGTPSPLTDQMGKSVKNMAFPLPTEPVGVGDSWTSETELPISQIVSTSAPLKAKSKLTVKQLQIAGADTTVVLAVETSFPTDPVTVTQQGQTSTLRFSGTLTGERQFSVSKGAPLGSTMSGTMRITASGGQLGPAGMTMALEQRTSLELTDRK